MSDTKELLQQTRNALRKDMASVRKRIDAVLKEAKPIEDELDSLVAKQVELNALIEAKSQELNKAREPELHDLKMELASIARADAALNDRLR